MKQLVQLQDVKDEFAKRGVKVIALSLEAGKMEDHAGTLKRFPNRMFALGAAIEGKGAPGLARTTGYLVDGSGVVQQIMPMEAYNRPSWWAVLNEIDRLMP